MNPIRRTTLAADRRDLDTLESEARRRGVTLTTLLAEAVTEKAERLRKAHRPRLGVGRSTDGLTARDLTSEPVAEPLP